MSVFEQLSRREREVMEVLFSLGKATLGELAEQMQAPPTRPAMRSIVKILEDKGHLEQSGKSGREHVFRPRRRVAKEGRNALSKILTTFFGGSMKDGLAAYLNDPAQDLDPQELEKIEAMIREAKTKASSRRETKA
jgi:BlaI family transcriptional regulator, penicillinase repressor